MGSVSEPEYVNRRPADQQPDWLDASPAYPNSAGQRSPRPRIGKESSDTEDVIYGQVRVPTVHRFYFFSPLSIIFKYYNIYKLLFFHFDIYVIANTVFG